MTEQLPRGWAHVTLRELADEGVFADGDWVESKDQDPNGEVRLIQLADVGAGRFVDKSSRFLTAEKAEELGCTFLNAGDVLISRMADPIGRACIFPGAGRPCVTVVDVCILRPGDKRAEPRWLTGAINSPQFRAKVELAASGTTRSRVSRSNLGALSLPVPPPNEQRRIVAKLEALQTRSRRARQVLDAVPPLLEKLRQSILASAFRGDLTKDWRAKNKDVEPASKLLERIRTERRKKWEETELAKLKAKGKRPSDDKWKAKYKEPALVDMTGLPELPEGWCWAKASDVVAPDTVITYGIVLPGPPLDHGIPYVRGQDIEEGRILVDQLWRTTPEIAVAHSRSELAEGDVLLCIIRHLKVAIVPSGLDGANVTQGTVRLRPSSAILGSYVARWLEGPSAQGWMKARYFGNAMPRINVEDAREIPIPVAPMAEQQAIALAIAKRLEAVESAVKATASCSAQQASLDRATLAKAFRGELVPQDPSDEPAATMRARIAGANGTATNGAHPAPTRRKRGLGGKRGAVEEA